MSSTKKHFAFVTFIICGDTYVLAALVLAHSLRIQNTAYDTVCLIAPDVSKDAEVALKKVFTKVIRVLSISGDKEKCNWNAGRYDHMYKPWIHKSFTRFQALQLTDYEKICVIDADALAVSNPDDIFLISTPAAVISRVGDRGWKRAHGHGEKIDRRVVGNRPHQENASCGMLLLTPSRADHREITNRIRSKGGFGDPKCHWGPDEQIITEFYNEKEGGWTNISREFWCTAWRQKDLASLRRNESTEKTDVIIWDERENEIGQAAKVNRNNCYDKGNGNGTRERQDVNDPENNNRAERQTSTCIDDDNIATKFRLAKDQPKTSLGAVSARFLHYVSEKPWTSTENWPDMIQWKEMARAVLSNIGATPEDHWVVQGWNE